jgi:four helix bundle protein
MGNVKTHKDLDVWKEAMSLARAVYALTQSFPKEEVYGLTDQIRRSAVSVPSNIAEGAARGSDKDFIKFLSIALGSLAELETQLMLAESFGYAHTTSCRVCRSKLAEALEKLLKGDLVGRGWALERTHDLQRLCDKLAEYDAQRAETHHPSPITQLGGSLALRT